MATQKTLPTKITVESFIEGLDDEKTKKDCYEISRMMEEVSKEPPVMWGPAIIGFGKYHYKYESGREGDSMIIGFSPRRQNLTLYVGAGSAALAPLLEKLGKHKTSKGCLYIKTLDDIDRVVLKKLIATAYAELKQKHVG